MLFQEQQPEPIYIKPQTQPTQAPKSFDFIDFSKNSILNFLSRSPGVKFIANMQAGQDLSSALDQAFSSENQTIIPMEKEAKRQELLNKGMDPQRASLIARGGISPTQAESVNNMVGGFMTGIKPVGFLKKGVKAPEDTITAFAKQALREAKGLSASDIMVKHPDLNLKRDVPVTDIYGKKQVIPEGEALTPYELKGNKVLLQDGETYIVSKNQYQNIKGQSVTGEAVPFAPELKGTEETIKGGAIQNEIKRMPGESESDYLERLDLESGLIPEATTNSLTKFSQYTLPGGKNYKEILIKAPTKPIPQELPEGFKVFKNPDGGYAVVNPAGAYVSETGTTKAKAIENYQKRYNKDTSSFKSSHWDEPNVISHLRLNERTYKGKKVTFMEELQSDWAREGRSKGFATDITKDTAKQQGFTVYKTKDTTGGESYFIDNPTDQYFYRKGFSNTGFDTEAQAWDSIIAKLKETNGAVPNNPLLKNWQELSVKRALQEAVNNKSDYFSWTTGEQQAARYNLSKEIKNITWTPPFEGLKTVNIIPKNAPEMRFHVDKAGKIQIRDGDYGRGTSEWEGKNLSDVIGKGIAEKIMSESKGELAGEGLNFGGEWAKNLYDKQVKSIVEKVTGGKVETIDMGLPIGGLATDRWVIPATKRGATGIDLTADKLKVGMEVVNTQDQWIITDILGDGKFKAVPKSALTREGYYENLDLIDIKKLAEQLPDVRHSIETFDISTKTTKQQAIKLTPEIKSKIRGEAPKLKKPSGKSPIKYPYSIPLK